MYSRFKLNIIATSILVCSFGSAAKAQLASDKSLNEIYNKQIIEKLNKKDKSKDLSKSTENHPNVASSNPLLKNVPNRKIKNPEIVAHSKLMHSDSNRSNEQKKKKLPSNSLSLKQMGTPAKLQKIHSQ